MNQQERDHLQRLLDDRSFIWKVARQHGITTDLAKRIITALLELESSGRKSRVKAAEDLANHPIAKENASTVFGVWDTVCQLIQEAEDQRKREREQHRQQRLRWLMHWAHDIDNRGDKA